MRQLTVDVPVDLAERNAEQQGRWILAHILDFHRREEKACAPLMRLQSAGDPITRPHQGKRWMRVEDYFANGKRWWVSLHEKGGKRHEMPAHHKLETFLDEYIRAAGIGGEPKSPLFRSARGKTGQVKASCLKSVRMMST
jgi:hypothetical protein